MILWIFCPLGFHTSHMAMWEVELYCISIIYCSLSKRVGVAQFSGVAQIQMKKSVFVWDLNLLYWRLYHITITIIGLLFQCKTALHTEWLRQCIFLSTHVCSTLTWPVVVESIRCHWVSNFYKPFVHLCIYTSSVLIYCGILKRQRWRKRAGDKPAPANQAGVRLTGPSTLTGQ